MITKKWLSITAMGWCCFLLFTMDGHPESHKDDSSGTQVYTLGEIVVTRKKEGVESIGTVHRVTQEDISISGARNLNEAVNLLPGINVMVGGDAVPKIDIRGFRPRHNILLLNGIPINSTYDQQFNPSIIPVENIAEIKLTSGPSSVLYGQGGLGGVINIITKRGGEGISGMVGAQVGAGLSHLVKGSVSGRKGRMDYFTSASYSSRDAYPLSAVFEPAALEDGAKRNNSDKEAGSLFANLGYDPSSVLRLGLTFSYLFGEYGIPPNVHDPETDIFAAKPKYRRIEPYQGYSIQGAFELFPEASPLSLRGWLYFNQMGENSNRYSDDQYDDFIRDRSLVTYRLKNETRVLGITLQPQYAIGDTGILTMGLTAQRDMWKSQGTAWNIWSSTWPPGYTPNEVNDEKAISLYSIKLEYDWQIRPKIGLIVGYAYHHQRRHNHDDSVDTENPGRIVSPDRDSDSDYSLLIGSHYPISPHTRLKAAFQRNMRFPSIRQLYEVDAGNPELTTERVYHFSLGIEQQVSQKLHLSLDGFHAIAHDFIEKDSRRSERFENFDEYLFTGAELAARIHAPDNLFVQISYAYLETEDNTGSDREELQYRPAHRFTVEAKYTFPWGLIPYLSMVCVKDQYYYSKGGSPWEPPVKAKLDDYCVINMKLNYRHRDWITLYVGADNILDENYQQSYGYPLSGRFLFGGFELRLK